MMLSRVCLLDAALKQPSFLLSLLKPVEYMSAKGSFSINFHLFYIEIIQIGVGNAKHL